MDPQMDHISRCILHFILCCNVTHTFAMRLTPLGLHNMPTQRAQKILQPLHHNTSPHHCCSGIVATAKNVHPPSNPPILLTTQTSLHYHFMSMTPCYTSFHAEYAPGEDITIQIPITQPVKTELDIYCLILHNQTAQEQIYQQINGMYLICGCTIFLHHPLLHYPLILYPSTLEADFSYMLERLIINYLLIDLQTLWGGWHL